VRIHERAWGAIVEVHEGGRTLALVRLDRAGGIEDEHRLAWAA
jgi:hypothetical protein